MKAVSELAKQSEYFEVMRERQIISDVIELLSLNRFVIRYTFDVKGRSFEVRPTNLITYVLMYVTLYIWMGYVKNPKPFHVIKN